MWRKFSEQIPKEDSYMIVYVPNFRGKPIVISDVTYSQYSKDLHNEYTGSFDIPTDGLWCTYDDLVKSAQGELI